MFRVIRNLPGGAEPVKLVRMCKNGRCSMCRLAMPLAVQSWARLLAVPVHAGSNKFFVGRTIWPSAATGSWQWPRPASAMTGGGLGRARNAYDARQRVFSARIGCRACQRTARTLASVSSLPGSGNGYPAFWCRLLVSGFDTHSDTSA
jgi:hypothetical protein